MDIKVFERAKSCRNSIDAIESKIYTIKKLERRTGDIDFVELQNVAIEALRELQSLLEQKFNEL